MQKLLDSLSNLKLANLSLQRALDVRPRDEVIASAIIKNFEFNYELSWKAMRRLLLFHGVTTSTPRQAIAESYRKGLLESESTWLAMIDDKNQAVHAYDAAFARDLATRIEQAYLPIFDAFLERLQKDVQSL